MAPGCGAEAIRKRKEAKDQRRRAREQGLVLDEKDFEPAKNKNFCYYTPARDNDVQPQLDARVKRTLLS